MKRLAILFGFLLLQACGAAEPETETIAGPPQVVSGDEIEVQGRRFRLYAVDAPEPGQRCLMRRLFDCGAIARDALLDLTAGAEVACWPMPEIGPNVARCKAQGYDLSEGMAYTGWALADRAVSDDYLRFEQDAEAQKRGLWRGRFVAPWDWRRGERLPEEAE